GLARREILKPCATVNRRFALRSKLEGRSSRKRGKQKRLAAKHATSRKSAIKSY
ncbi:hypothetical protein HMPREF1576_01151, partial [Gardnerella pickettii JCP7719]